MDNQIISAEIITPEISAYTFPSGPKGNGITNIEMVGNTLVFTFDDGATQNVVFPLWWFGTRSEYNAMTAEKRAEYTLHFIEEDS